MARRKNKLIDGFLYLKIAKSGFGILETPKIPDTALYQSEELTEYVAEGIKITPIIPMKKWRIQYEGKMKQFNNRSQTYDVQIDLEWVTELPYFHFDRDMDKLAMAKAVAMEPWSREYFQTLKKYILDSFGFCFGAISR